MRWRFACLATIIAVFAATIGDACSISIPIWSPSKFSDGLFRFVHNGKTGYIDPKGQIVIQPSAVFNSTWNSNGEFTEGLVAIPKPRAKEKYLNDGYRYLNRFGKIMFESKHGGRFSEGLLAVENDGVEGYVDHSGKFKISPQFRTAASFSDGLALAALPSDRDHVGYIDHAGAFAIPATLTWGSDFHEGFAAAVVDSPCKVIREDSCGFLTVFGPTKPDASYDCRRTFINKSGKSTTNLRFDDVGAFSESLAPARVGKLWGYIDTFGHFAIEPRFEWASPFTERVAAVRSEEGAGFIDHSGKFVIPPRFFLTESFSGGRALVTDDVEKNRYRFINHSGRQAFPRRFEFATSFVHGLAAVAVDRRTVDYIDITGKTIFSYRQVEDTLGR